MRFFIIGWFKKKSACGIGIEMHSSGLKDNIEVADRIQNSFKWSHWVTYNFIWP